MVASARGEGPVLRYPPFSFSRSTSFGQEHAQGKTLRVPRKKPRTGQTPSVILCVLCCALESPRHRNQLTCDQLKACMLMARNRLESLSAQWRLTTSLRLRSSVTLYSLARRHLETYGRGSIGDPLEWAKHVVFSSGKPVANPVANYNYGGLGVFLS